MQDATLEERLDAVERALTDDASASIRTDAHEDLERRVAALEADLAELRAAVQAVRGYVGDVKHVNDEVEQRADAALAKAEAVERALVADSPAAADAPADEGPAVDSSSTRDGSPPGNCSSGGDSVATGPSADAVGVAEVGGRTAAGDERRGDAHSADREDGPGLLARLREAL